MENTARLYNCARCQCQVVICSDCDRGNIYCNKQCAEIARKASLRAAGRDYQRTRSGRLKHAARQYRYRARRKKVTHQGSPTPAADDSLTPTTRSETQRSIGVVQDEGISCHFCTRPCSRFLRLDFIHRRSAQSVFDRDHMHWPPRIRARAP